MSAMLFYLKNKHAYACKWGYLVKNTKKQNQQEEEGKGTVEDNEWGRGDGWGRVSSDDDGMYESEV